MIVAKSSYWHTVVVVEYKVVVVPLVELVAVVVEQAP